MIIKLNKIPMLGDLLFSSEKEGTITCIDISNFPHCEFRVNDFPIKEENLIPGTVYKKGASEFMEGDEQYSFDKNRNVEFIIIK